ncbi:MAG TPA: TetR/AcrR family transcriptional regulator [Gemmatimonadales bacterium]|nr:TetR/AcrR family transcriptional regulator [Gemmatimonadales bacterium]
MAHRDTQERLIQTAAGLWHARSYADVGVNEICEAADVRKGSFYHFFASKQELAVAVIDRHWSEAYENVVMPALAAGATPMAQLQELTVGIADEVDRLTDELGVVPGCPFGNLAVELSTIDGAVRERLERLFESQKELLRDLLERAVAAGELPDATDTADAARAMHAYIEGVLLVSKNANDASIVRRLLPLALRLAVEGTPAEAARV